jgi:tyrosyl-tRNA synthetase
MLKLFQFWWLRLTRVILTGMNKVTSAMTLSQELTWRGFVNQTTISNITKLDENKLRFYHGFDASVDSLTIGNLAAVMMDKVFMKHGYQAVMLAGGATSLIGDPGGKDSERPLQDEETIHKNVAAVNKQLQQLVGQSATMVNNLDWFNKMNVVEFLRDVGKYFSMTPLIQRDYIAKRLGEGGVGITYTEFSYTLLQGYDFLYLYDKYQTTLQLAGADQWGNSISGVDLVRRVKGVEVNAYTCPLIINKATGKKFGKSEEGAVWLDANKTSPTQFYQFWINSDDEGVEGYLKVFTELDKEEIDRVLHHHKEAPQQRTAQTVLAQQVTELVHGQTEMKQAEAVTEYLVGEASIKDAGAAVLAVIRNEQPSAHSQPGGSIVDVLVSTGLASSNTEARRLLTGNAISVNDQKISREEFTAEDFLNGRLLIRKGKKFKDSALVEI